MDIELQRKLFAAEDKYISFKESQEEHLNSFKKIFAVSAVLLLIGALIPVLLFHSENDSIAMLVGLATGSLVLCALVALLLTFVAWRSRFLKQLRTIEDQLITAQKALIQPYLPNPTSGQLAELGFSRFGTPTEDVQLGSVLLSSESDATELLTLSYTTQRGYMLEITREQ